MNKLIRELAEESGFCFWDGESWAPPNAEIDWGGQYDEEFQKYTELLIEHITQRLLDSRLITIPMAIQIYKDYGIEE